MESGTIQQKGKNKKEKDKSLFLQKPLTTAIIAWPTKLKSETCQHPHRPKQKCTKCTLVTSFQSIHPINDHVD